MIAAAWVAMAAAPWWLYPIVALVVAGRLHALGVVLHDATHMPLRRKTAAVRVVEVLCGYPIASTLNAMRYHHLRHHRDSGMHTDPYYKAGRQNVALADAEHPARPRAAAVLELSARSSARSRHLVPRLRNVYAHVFLQDRTSDDLRESPEVVECARAEWGQVAFQALVVALAVAVSGSGPVGIRRAGQHRRPSGRPARAHRAHLRARDRSSDRDDHRHDQRQYLGVFGALGLAPRNIGYHIVHHIHPQVRLGALPRLRDWYAQKHPQLYPPARR